MRPTANISVMPNGSINALGNSGSVSAFHINGKAFSPAFLSFFSKNFSTPLTEQKVLILWIH